MVRYAKKFKRFFALAIEMVVLIGIIYLLGIFLGHNLLIESQCTIFKLHQHFKLIIQGLFSNFKLKRIKESLYGSMVEVS